jgi:hypothetical protein
MTLHGYILVLVCETTAVAHRSVAWQVLLFQLQYVCFDAAAVGFCISATSSKKASFTHYQYACRVHTPETYSWLHSFCTMYIKDTAKQGNCCPSHSAVSGQPKTAARHFSISTH